VRRIGGQIEAVERALTSEVECTDVLRSDVEYRRLTHLEYRIRLMRNPNENDHQKLETLIHKIVNALGQSKEGEPDFFESHSAVLARGAKY
jgi:hypothetical protein